VSDIVKSDAGLTFLEKAFKKLISGLMKDSLVGEQLTETVSDLCGFPALLAFDYVEYIRILVVSYDIKCDGMKAKVRCRESTTQSSLQVFLYPGLHPSFVISQVLSEEYSMVCR
jgi:hypothetical protein